MIETIAAIFQSATPLIYATLAGTLAQRSGIWHLGLEGLLIAAACSSVVTTRETSSVVLGLSTAIGVCIVGSVALWIAIEKLKANPIIAGLGLTGLGLSGSDLYIQALYGSEASVHVTKGLPRIGASSGDFAGLSVLVLAMPVVVLMTWGFLRRTRLGLQMTASGEHPFAARSVGISPAKMRLLALVLGGVLCGLGGTELGLGSLDTFSVGMTAGRGFMAFAAVVFGAADPLGGSAAAMFFAAVENLGIRAQIALGTAVPSELVQSLPYLATVAGIWLASSVRGGAKSSADVFELRDF